MRELTEEEQIEVRRILDDYTFDHPDTISSHDAIYVIGLYHDMIGTDGQLLSHLHRVIDRQFAKGQRCGVCAMTPNQSKFENYNCREEC